MLQDVQRCSLSLKDRAGLSYYSCNNIALFHLFAVMNEYLALNGAVNKCKCSESAVDSRKNTLSL